MNTSLCHNCKEWALNFHTMVKQRTQYREKARPDKICTREVINEIKLENLDHFEKFSLDSNKIFFGRHGVSFGTLSVPSHLSLCPLCSFVLTLYITVWHVFYCAVHVSAIIVVMGLIAVHFVLLSIKPPFGNAQKECLPFQNFITFTHVWFADNCFHVHIWHTGLLMRYTFS